MVWLVRIVVGFLSDVFWLVPLILWLSAAIRAEKLVLPTVASSVLPGYASESTLGLFAPAATPPAIIRA